MQSEQQILLITAGAIYLMLAGMHLIYTLFTDKLSPRNKQLIETMRGEHMNLTRQTTVWKAWVGFNISHSLGAIFIGLINIIWAVQYPTAICQSRTLLLLNVITSISYLISARKYWFSVPLWGITVSTLCFIAAAVPAF